MGQNQNIQNVDLSKIHTGSELFGIEKIYKLREVDYKELKNGWTNKFLFSCYISAVMGFAISTITSIFKTPENKKIYEHAEIKILIGLGIIGGMWLIFNLITNKSQCKIIKKIDKYFEESEDK